MLGCYQNSNERKERNRTAARSIQYIHELRKMCVHISMCVWLFVCTFGGVRVLKYTRDAILYAPLCAHTYSHTFAGRMRKAAQEMKWKFCFCRWRRRAPPHYRPPARPPPLPSRASLHNCWQPNLLPANIVGGENGRAALSLRKVRSPLWHENETNFIYVHTLCVSVCSLFW